MITATDIRALGGALDGVSAELAPGEYVALLGANGSGKSTLLKALLGLIDIDAGQVRVEGLDPYADADALAARQQVGYVQQRPDDQIVATSAEDDVAFGPENLGLPREELRARVTASLAAVGLSGFEQREPHTLSGGQKQRLVIAGALALRPRYLLLDEPTSQLDPQAQREVLAILDDQVARGCGVLHVTHDLAEARRAQRLLVLHEGRLVFSGSYDELLACPQEELVTWNIELKMPVYERARYEGGEPAGDHAPGPLALALQEASLAYESGDQCIRALQDATLTLSPGEFILVRGATGSGKSTLLNLMAGFLTPSEGSATIDGQPLTLKTARGRVGFIFQDSEAQLFAETVLDDVAFGPRNFGASDEEAHRRATEALSAVGLDPEVFGGRSPFQLSGGQARRAAIAGVLALRPRYLLADEPTSALDAAGRNAVRRLLAQATAHAGVLVVTHSPEQFAEMATSVYELDAGCLRRVD
ncbi:MAG: energy-coupling factor transporter ATPase [Actinomycetia bacterium]|nr:energy-coupling factor transporter ATPase [Actinomycetes bacterium]